MGRTKTFENLEILILDNSNSKEVTTKERGAGATGIGADVGQFFKENLDIPAGILGAVGGMKLAAPTANPWIIGTAGIVGGATGTFGGVIASDALTQEDLSNNRNNRPHSNSSSFSNSGQTSISSSSNSSSNGTNSNNTTSSKASIHHHMSNNLTAPTNNVQTFSTANFHH